MATRGQIGVKGSDVLIYKHWDCYPEETLPTLKDTVGVFYEERGNDPEYCVAQIVRAYARRDEERRKERKERAEKGEQRVMGNYESPSMTGWGLRCKHVAPDIEYFYWVDLEEPAIEVYECQEWGYETVENVRERAPLKERLKLETTQVV